MGPDLFVDDLPGGGFKIRLAIPQSRIDAFYLGSALERIERRRREIVVVATSIFDLQSRFLDDAGAIERLRMQQIADNAGLPLRTVIRAVGERWVQTRRGLYPLKRFVAGEVKKADHEVLAENKKSIQAQIQQLVAEEDKEKPYRDDDLVAQLEKHGFRVARRTITKYRKKLGIPSSRQRRR